MVNPAERAALARMLSSDPSRRVTCGVVGAVGAEEAQAVGATTGVTMTTA